MTVSKNRKRKIVFFQIYESDNEASIKTNDSYLRTTYSHFCKEQKGHTYPFLDFTVQL